MPIIALEEHYATRQFLDGPGRPLMALIELMERNLAAQLDRRQGGAARGLLEQLTDLTEDRIAQMDAARVDVQVLSLTTPGLEQLDPPQAVPMARQSNDELADRIAQYPSRFAGFAALPMADPSQAANELERTVRDHRFVGALINGHSQGRYLDDEFFWPVLERAEALDVPLYLHPTSPPQPIIDLMYTGNFSASVTTQLATGAWGWHIETATHVVRLILSGAFDRFPTLQLIVGHMGEALPFMLPRLDRALPVRLTSLQRAPSDYLRENLHYTFSGFNWIPAFLELLCHVGMDRIMFSTDHPFGSMCEATAFLADLPISPADRERIAHRNAERLLKLYDLQHPYR